MVHRRVDRLLRGAANLRRSRRRRQTKTFCVKVTLGNGDHAHQLEPDDVAGVLEQERDVMLYKDSSKDTRVTVAKAKDGSPTLDTTESGGGGYAASGKAGGADAAPSRGYTEEMEHWAWCIRNPSPENQPRCKPEVAIADAVIALVSNIALGDPAKVRIDFKPEWFDIGSDETPEGVVPDVNRDKYKI